MNQMSHVDPLLLASEWRWVFTKPDDPFMLGDSPVITFARAVDGKLDYGMGFHEPNVEVALPMSPTACLHLLPAVANRRPAQMRPHGRSTGGRRAMRSSTVSAMPTSPTWTRSCRGTAVRSRWARRHIGCLTRTTTTTSATS